MENSLDFTAQRVESHRHADDERANGVHDEVTVLLGFKALPVA